MDFNIQVFFKLINALKNKGFSFQTVEEFIKDPKDKVVIFRHDVDRHPKHSFQFALIEYEYDIKGTYYFRIVNKSFHPEIIRNIVNLGHEIGYHYEDLALSKGNPEKAIVLFKNHLERLREFYPVKTICMHGSPLSKFDNKELWKSYNYFDFGIIAEPYFDLDYTQLLYLTDTGRRWNGFAVSIRDKDIESNHQNDNNEVALLSRNYIFNVTSDIIHAVENESIPNKLLITFHPERWTDRPTLWMKELIWQNFKNLIKFMVVKSRVNK